MLQIGPVTAPCVRLAAVAKRMVKEWRVQGDEMVQAANVGHAALGKQRARPVNLADADAATPCSQKQAVGLSTYALAIVEERAPASYLTAISRLVPVPAGQRRERQGMKAVAGCSPPRVWQRANSKGDPLCAVVLG